MASRCLLPTHAGMRAGIPALPCSGHRLSLRMSPTSHHMRRQAPAQRHTQRCQGTRMSPLCMAQQAQQRQWKQQAAAVALVIGMKLTAAWYSAAEAAKHAWAGWHHPQSNVGQETSAAAQAQPSPSLSATAAATAAAALVFVQEKADNFVQLMLRMDKPSITLESKWADLQQLRHDEIGQRMQRLFAASQTASKTAATMLAQTGGTLQASYWQSQETKQVMEEEDALRSAIFAQMLSASS
eukprot:jgi/Astpho2/8657/Aster-05130